MGDEKAVVMRVKLKDTPAVRSALRSLMGSKIFKDDAEKFLKLLGQDLEISTNEKPSKFKDQWRVPVKLGNATKTISADMLMIPNDVAVKLRITNGRVSQNQKRIAV